jgi:hypothetical protein
MSKLNEIGQLILVLIILMFVVNFKAVTTNTLNLENFLIKSIGITLIVLISILGKILFAYHFETKLSFKIWEWQRFGFRRESKFNNPVPAGIIIPFLASILSLGHFLWLGVLEFDFKIRPSRATKRHEMYKFSELTDTQLSFISGGGVIACLITSIIFYFGNFPEISKLAIYYAFWSLIPLGNLDGTKIFFGNRIYWYTLSIITLIFLAYALFLP